MSLVNEASARTHTVSRPDQPLRCVRCDVAWRGVVDDMCWICGGPGAPRGEVRVVDDDSAA